MVRRKTALKFRKAHRYLGLFIAIQCIIWTVSGIYFSWTDLEEIHGDQFRKHHVEKTSFSGLKNPAKLISRNKIHSPELKDVTGKAYYFVNGEYLVNAVTGEDKKGITEEEALLIAQKNMVEGLEAEAIERIEETGKHHEYRSGLLPAYVIFYDNPQNLKAYISLKDASFRTVRHREWRWFDFSGMIHTMDYEGRDEVNNLVLRFFSLLNLIAVLSGFILWYISSPSIRKIQKQLKSQISIN